METAVSIQEKSPRDRFAFGENWTSFIAVLDEQRIAAAEQSLRTLLEVDSLVGRTFLDVGSGSGLFSLAAMRLGAERVFSFDYDPKSVACTAAVRDRFYADTDRWSVERGDVLSPAYLGKLGEWDVVYSWGVLHHTGDMWTALDHVAPLVAAHGQLFIAIYNDQGRRSEIWKSVKRFYNEGAVQQRIALAGAYLYFAGTGFIRDLLRLRNPLAPYRERRQRGMSLTHDWKDWVGGYPFEVAKPEDILAFYRGRGFILERLTTANGGHGNNQFVFRKAG